MVALTVIEGRRVERLRCDECGTSRPKLAALPLEEPMRWQVVDGRELCPACVWDLECAGFFAGAGARVERRAAA